MPFVRFICLTSLVWAAGFSATARAQGSLGTGTVPSPAHPAAGAIFQPAAQPATPPAANPVIIEKQDIGNIVIPPAARNQYWFGVVVANIPPVMATQLKLQRDQGLLVVAVMRDSPAAAAGLKADDLLVEINGKPLISQEQLARAANAVTPNAIGTKSVSVMQPAMIIYMRDGERQSATLVSSPRPAKYFVLGANAESFSPTHNGTTVAGLGTDVRNITVAPSGATFIVGGYQFDLHGQDSTSIRVLRDAVGKGETVVMSQEVDDAGKTRCTLTMAGKTWEVTPDKLPTMPENVRIIAQQLLSSLGQGPAASAPQSPIQPAGLVASLERQIEAQQQQIGNLQKQLGDMQRQMDRLVEGLLPKQSPAAGTDVADKVK